jgi:hypothetical protein
MNGGDYEYVQLADLEVDDKFTDPVSKKLWTVRHKIIDTRGKAHFIISYSEILAGDPDEVIQIKRHR